MGEYTNISSTDATLLALWKYFHYHPLGLNVLKEPAHAYEEHVIIPAFPSATRCRAHGEACKVVYDLSVALNERREPEAMDRFVALAEEELLTTLLLPRDIIDAIASLNLALGEKLESSCLSDVKAYIDKTQDALKKLTN